VQKYRDPHIIFRSKCKPCIFPNLHAYHVKHEVFKYVSKIPIFIWVVQYQKHHINTLKNKLIFVFSMYDWLKTLAKRWIICSRIITKALMSCRSLFGPMVKLQSAGILFIALADLIKEMVEVAPTLSSRDNKLKSNCLKQHLLISDVPP